MACFCSSFDQFYLHTFHPELLGDITQGHLLILVNTEANYLQTIKIQLRRLEGLPHVVSLSRNEFVGSNGTHIYEVLAVLAQPEH